MSSQTRVLFVDDEPYVLSGLQRMLFELEDRWEMEFVASGQAAIEAFERQPFDVVVTDMRMPEMDGAQLLLTIQKRWPLSVRIILSGQAEKEMILRAIGPSHRFLPKPCECDLLVETISKACGLHARLATPELRKLVASQTSLPGMQRIYDVLINELQTGQPSQERVAELISQDSSLSRQLLQIVNSALPTMRSQLLRRPVRLNSILDVVRTIGIDRLRPLILSAGIFAHFSDTAPLDAQKEQFVMHSSTVSRLAQAIVEREMPGNPAAAAAALLGGLIHDVGKLVLAQSSGDEYWQLIDDALKSGRTTCAEELARFGYDHSAVGAYLLALWGIPDNIVEVVAYHHDPARSGDRRFSPTTAVHVADALDHACRTGQPEQVDRNYLHSLGVVHKLPRWRELMPTNQHSWFYPAMVEGSRGSTDNWLPSMSRR